jgi:hypothetical protein
MEYFKAKFNNSVAKEYCNKDVYVRKLTSSEEKQVNWGWQNRTLKFVYFNGIDNIFCYAEDFVKIEIILNGETE